MTTPQALIEQIHTAGQPFVIALTGGGSGAISSLLEVPGASASVLEAVVPYAPKALADWLGGTPDHYCSERTARAMAMGAFERARTLSNADVSTLRGIGATASLASNRLKRGPHRIHVAWQSAEMTVVVSCTFPSEGYRANEERLSTQLILSVVAEACGLEQSSRTSLDGFEVERREQRASQEIRDLLLGERQFVGLMPDTPIIFPGSFNPLHSAHKRMAAIAAERYGLPVTFEISVKNVEKPSLDFLEIADRIAQFPDNPVLLTRLPTFEEKAKISPGCTFVVGVDTVLRIADPKYYGGDLARRDTALDSITRKCCCGFLVFGRIVHGQFRTLSEVDLPLALREMCDEVPASDFREDVSSTALRGG